MNSRNMIDIITVTYNSTKWIESYLKSFANSPFDIGKLNFYFVDNGSNDNTVETLESKLKVHQIPNYEIHKLTHNKGFGYANNYGAQFGESDFIFFLNIDTEIFPNTMSELFYAFETSERDVVAFELRQFPYEHPKYYNPLTLEVSWASAAALALKRSAFEVIKGFDERIFMYCEDVDLSWRLRSHGYKLKYVPRAIITHHSYEEPDKIKPLQFIHSIYNNLMLRYRYGSLFEILKGYFFIFGLVILKKNTSNVRKLLIKKLIKSIKEGLEFRGGILSKYRDQNLYFDRFDYELARDGAFYPNLIQSYNPLVSIIIRTHNRPEVLRETLQSLQNQTYDNFEVILVEDGENESEVMVTTEFSDLNIIYYSTKKHVGRSLAGNIGLKLAQGDYINFLDDDDLFFADHIQTLVSEVLRNRDVDAVYSTAFETPIKIHSLKPYKYTEMSKYVKYNKTFSKTQLLNNNLFPIQSVLFKRELYDKHGGFDESYSFNEDWDLWLRFAHVANFKKVNKTTSIYRVPADVKTSNERHQNLVTTYNKIRNDYKNIYFTKKPLPTVKYKFNSVIYNVSVDLNEMVNVSIKVNDSISEVNDLKLVLFTNDYMVYYVDITKLDDTFIQEIPLSLFNEFDIKSIALICTQGDNFFITNQYVIEEKKLLTNAVKLKRFLKKNKYLYQWIKKITMLQKK